MHNTKALRTGRILEKFPEITARLARMVDRFTSILDCMDTSYPHGESVTGQHPCQFGPVGPSSLHTNSGDGPETGQVGRDFLVPGSDGQKLAISQSFP